MPPVTHLFPGLLALAASEFVLPLPGGASLTLGTRGPSALLLRLAAAPLHSPCVAPDNGDAAFSEVNTQQGRGVRAAFGSLLLTPDARLLLLDAQGGELARSAPLGTERSLSLSAKEEGRLYGGGGSMDDALQLATGAVLPRVANLGSHVPFYYSPADGYAALGISDETAAGVPDGGPGRNDATANMHVVYKKERGNVTWWWRGGFELYLLPAKGWSQAAQAYYGLTGAPRLPPRYAFGFIASRWGWRDRADVEAVLARFRAERFPLDAFIVDFEFFTTFNDYSLGAGGSRFYSDFGFNGALFPEPARQLAGYKAEYGVRMGGIRKPRLGNDALLMEAREKGLTADARLLKGPANILQRWLNFSKAETRDWYGGKLEGYLEAGVDFWWNDEGEAEYFTFQHWNEAELAAQRRAAPEKRFFSLNRAFTPGMARLGAAVWTGDTSHSWDHLRRTPALMLKWAMAGAPYVACDIGGFLPSAKEEPDLVLRWYQVGVFMPIMRVHSMNQARPRWPWLWGEEHAKLMRQALELRYRLLPYHYSLAAALYTHGEPWTRPLLADFPEDANASEVVGQWMDGRLLVAPVLRKDSVREVYLPQGLWYPLNSSAQLQGPRRLAGRAALEEVPVFASAGTVLPLAPVLQSTQALPGGPLEVQVYAGASGEFRLLEDDGETRAYEAGARRSTLLAWDENSHTLSWSVEGPEVPGAFKEVYVRLLEPAGVQCSAVQAIGEGGTVSFGAAVRPHQRLRG